MPPVSMPQSPLCRVRSMSDQAKSDEIYFRAAKILFWVVFFGIISFAAIQAWPIARRALNLLTPFILGLILAYILYPIVQMVQHRLKLGRIAGILAVAAFVIGIIGTFSAILVPVLYRQTGAVLNGLREYFSPDQVDRLLERVFPDDERRQEFEESLQAWFDDMESNLSNLMKPETLRPVAQQSMGAVKGAVQAVFSVFGWLGGIMATLSFALIITFYYLADMEKIPPIIRRILPSEQGERIWQMLVASDKAVGGFLRGQLIACIGVGCLASILLFLVGLREYAVLIGFMAGAINFIPYLGPTVGALPAILWALFTTDLPGWASADEPTLATRALVVVVIIGGFAVIQMVDGFIFQPFIVGKQAALHPLAVMLALIVGAQFGIGGMILAVPAACVVKVVFVEFYWKGRRDFIESAAEK